MEHEARERAASAGGVVRLGAQVGSTLLAAAGVAVVAHLHRVAAVDREVFGEPCEGGLWVGDRVAATTMALR